ncbi:E3 ubiquitin-protein ligase rnf19b [Goodea atripinnis]|uniref:E3 ubiquitin-protein ligase rnf19b n=1 Tax=Goodea atripinnis TaxID=208336 RepID=A0ABV0MZD3_9TELE
MAVSAPSEVEEELCRAAGKRQGRISFHSLFHRKRGSRSGKSPKGGGATHHQTQQQVLPSALSSTPTAASATTTTAATNSKDTASNTPSDPLSFSQPCLGGAAASGEPNLLECPLCLVRQPAEQLPELLGCSHRSCLCCLRQYLRIEITESRVQLSCPECAERLVPRQVADILDDAALLEKYEEFLLRRCLASDPDCRWCPAPDCG